MKHKNSFNDKENRPVLCGRFFLKNIILNDTPLKELLGITVVSTDFKYMGSKMAEIILGKKQKSVKVPFRFIDRKSM